MVAPRPKTKSGFTEGRKGASLSKPKGKQTAADRRLEKLNKAKSDLADVLSMDRDEEDEDEDEDYEDRPRGSIGNDVKHKMTRFGKEVELIRASISNESDDLNAEATNKRFIRAVLSSTIDLLAVAEANYRETKKEQAGYVYAALSKQALELSNDLRLMGDVENQTRFIAESIVRPMFIAQVQNMLEELMYLKSNVDTLAGGRSNTSKKIKLKIDNVGSVVGRFMDGAQKRIVANIEMYLRGDMSFVETSDSKKRRK